MKAQSSQWRRSDEPPPLTARAVQSSHKRMASVFWDCEGILLIEWLPKGSTINSEYHVAGLKKLRDVIKKERNGKLSRGSFLQHDNVRPHTRAAIEELGFKVIHIHLTAKIWPQATIGY